MDRGEHASIGVNDKGGPTNLQEVEGTLHAKGRRDLALSISEQSEVELVASGEFVLALDAV